MLSTSLRSATQATDSTCSGCSANSAATTPLRQSAPVSLLEQEKEQQRVGDVEEQARQVMPARPQPVKLAVEHVRKHRDRMPVARDLTVPRPGKPFGAQAGLHVRIGGDVIRIVVVDELMPSDRPINHQRAHRQKQADPERTLPGGLRAGCFNCGHHRPDCSRPQRTRSSRFGGGGALNSEGRDPKAEGSPNSETPKEGRYGRLQTSLKCFAPPLQSRRGSPRPGCRRASVWPVTPVRVWIVPGFVLYSSFSLGPFSMTYECTGIGGAGAATAPICGFATLASCRNLRDCF